MTIEKELSEIALDINSSWKVIPELESYAINEDGIVMALPKIREGRLDNLTNHFGTTKKSQRKYKEHIIKPRYTSRYWYVGLMHNGIKKDYRVHRLVYRAFVGEIPDGMVIDHIDGNRNNNNVHNLRCVTPSENKQNPNTKYNGSKEIVQIDPTTMEVVNTFKSIMDASTSLGKSFCSQIGECCRGIWRTAFGYFWQYKEDWDKGINNIRKEYRPSILQYDLNDNFIAEYPNIKSASLIVGCTQGSIINSLKGRTKKPRKYIWKYRNN